MPLRSTTRRTEPDLSEVLDDLDKRLERLKRLYEQYFMGIQKVPPAQLHKEVERTIRELTQKQPRNTALRYRLTTLSQRFGSYNTYWNRVLRQIEQGSYVRDIARVKRRAYERGEEIPEEVLTKMPAAMRKRVLRDREAIARRHGDGRGSGAGGKAPEAAPVPGSEESAQPAYQIDESDPLLGGDLDTDMDRLFASLMAEDEPLGSDGPTPAAAAADEGGAPEVRAESLEEPSEVGAWREPAAASPPGSRRREPAVAGEGRARETGRSPAGAGAGQGAAPRRGAAPSGSGQGAGGLPPGMDEREARALYDKYVRARKMVGASSDVSYGRLMSTLRNQAPRIMQQHRAEGVEFNVVLKDNRVVVKARPKK